MYSWEQFIPKLFFKVSLMSETILYYQSQEKSQECHACQNKRFRFSSWSNCISHSSATMPKITFIPVSNTAVPPTDKVPEPPPLNDSFTSARRRRRCRRCSSAAANIVWMTLGYPISRPTKWGTVTSCSVVCSRHGCSVWDSMPAWSAGVFGLAYSQLFQLQIKRCTQSVCCVKAFLTTWDVKTIWAKLKMNWTPLQKTNSITVQNVVTSNQIDMPTRNSLWSPEARVNNHIGGIEKYSW